MSFDRAGRRRIVQVVAILAIAASAFAAGIAIAAQPKMTAALEALRTARTKLDQAEHDKGGHRVKALGLIDQAIDEVKAGIAAGA
jgi:hypothetical protein